MKKTASNIKKRGDDGVGKPGGSVRAPITKARDGIDGSLTKKALRIDRATALLAIMLGGAGTLMVFSAGHAYADVKYGDPYYFIKRQVIWLIIGIAVMFIAAHADADIYRRLSIPLYIGSLVLLVLTLIIGFAGNGAQRWISVGPLTIQPSEIAKLGVVMALSAYFDRFEERACLARGGKTAFTWGTLYPFLLILLPIILVMLQKHLSCIIIIGTLGITLILLAGIYPRYILAFIGAGCGAVASLALLTDYTKDRITVWLDPEKYKLTGGWQTLEGLMAIGSGGLFGKGFGRGELKYCYVSEPANDMIFAILCEELGFIGALFTIGLFAILIYRGFTVALHAERTFDRLVCLGICTQIAIQTLLNIAVVTNTIPNTGISLPFFSYGGSSLIMLFFEIGIILSISRRSTVRR